MAKRNFSTQLVNYGHYKKWDKTKKDLPELIRITEKVTAEIDVEFGYILEISGAKGKTLTFIIEHPPFLNEQGKITPSFEGEQFINSNKYFFFLGDKIWEPVDDKVGFWTMKTFIDNKLLYEKSIELVAKESVDLDW